MNIRFMGPKAGTAFNVSNITVGAESGSVNVTSWKLPTAASGLPVIDGLPRDGEVLTVNEVGLTGVTARQWKSNGVDIGGATAATYTLATAQDGTWITCEVVCDQGTLTTPQLRVYAPMAMASHNADDDAVLGLVPHGDMTHIAVADGDWSSSATWLGGLVPTAGAVVLIPRGRTVTYDVSAPAPRLDRVRVDGTLTWALDQSTQMLVETLAVTQMASMIIGTFSSRLPVAYTAEIIVSDRDYLTDNRGPTDIDLTRDGVLIGRGVVWQGTCSIWGAAKTSWMRTASGSPPMTGDTSITLEQACPTWRVGDTIVIGGTGLDSEGTSETEERVITGVDGATISFSGTLIHDHDHQNSDVLRNDLQAPVGNLTRNVVIRSESPNGPAWRDGHTMAMHPMSSTGVWSCEFSGLGRTQKTPETPAGIINGDGDFEIWSGATSTLTARANRNSRYPCHAHFVGFGKANRDVFIDCSVHDSPGWAMVHHGCEFDMNGCVMYDYAGAGMVGETSNEVGAWVNNLAVKSRAKYFDTPKNLESPEGISGDFFTHGYGFAFKGRAIRANENFFSDNSWGIVYHHRHDAGSITLPIDHLRSQLDLKDLQGVRSAGSSIEGKDFPIIHSADNEGCGVVGGLFVTKPGWQQLHGTNINLKRLKVWGFRSTGGNVEYINQYALTDWDCVAMGGVAGTAGVVIGNNAAQVAVVRARTQDCATSLVIGTNETIGAYTLWDADDPQHMDIARESVGDAADVSKPADLVLGTRTTVPDPVSIETDLPFVLGSWAGGTGFNETFSGIETGLLTDSYNALSPLPKVADPLSMPVSPSADLGTAAGAMLNSDGYWTYDSKNVVVFPLYFSDRVHATPIKRWHAIETTGSVAGKTNNGAFTISASEPVVSAAVITTAEDTPATLDILALATHADGAVTMTLSDSYYGADHGTFTVDAGSGTVGYTPDRGFVGTDLAWVWVEDGAGHSTRVDVSIRVGVTAAQEIAAGDWTLTQATGNAITFTLADYPDAGNRRILRTEYTTDGGSTWKRLCYKWILAPHVVSTDSNDVALSSAQALTDVQLRYVTDLGDTQGSDSKSITLD